MDVPDLETMNAEWQAWVATENALKEHGWSWNDEGLALFNAAILLWGERLVALRMTQTEEARETCLNEAQGTYDKLTSKEKK